MEASRYGDDRTLFVKRFFDHPAISAEDYSNALYYSYWSGGNTKEFFYWLLARADRQDLEDSSRKTKIFLSRTRVSRSCESCLETVGTESRHEAGRKRRVATRIAALERHSENTFPKSFAKLPLIILNDNTAFANESLGATN